MAIEFSTGGSSRERFQSALNEVKESGLKSLSNIVSKDEGISLLWSKEAVSKLIDIDDEVAKRVVVSTVRSIKLVDDKDKTFDDDFSSSDVAHKLVVDAALQPKVEGVEFGKIDQPVVYKVAYRPYSEHERLQFGPKGAVVLGLEQQLPSKGIPLPDL